jgi:hypothetical protein
MKFQEFKEKHKLITSYKYTWAPSIKVTITALFM